MKKILFLAFSMASLSMTAQGVGIGTTNPNVSSILDVESTTKGFLPPRMSEVQMNAIATPAEGLIVYCLDCTPKGLYNFDGTDWNAIGGAPAAPAVVADCNVNGFAGAYMAGFATSGTTFTVTVTNNSFSVATLSFQNSDLVLSGVSGLSVTATSPASATLNAGQSQLVTYTISGTPATTGTLSGTWTKLALNCTRTVPVTGLSASMNANYCDSALFNGMYVSGVAMNGSNTFAVTFTNTSASAINGLPAPATSNLALTWTGGGTITVASVSPAGTYNLAAGASRTFTYTLSGTPSTTGTLTGVWTYSDLTCTKVRNIGNGDATFTNAQNNAYVFSVNDLALPLNSQGTLSIGSTVNVAYTSGLGNYLAYTSPDVAISSTFCEDGASDWTLGYSYSAGTFASSGNIVVTLITKKAGVVTAWPAKRVASITTINFNCVSVPWSVNGNAYSNTVGIDEGGDAIRGGIAIGGGASGAAYDAAAVGGWVNITLAEYNGILTTVPGASKIGSPNMGNTPSSYNWSNGNTVVGGPGWASASGKYIVAIYLIGNTTSTNNILLKTSATINSGYSNYFGTISHNTTFMSYSACKRPSSVATGQYIAVYNGSMNLGLFGNVSPVYYSSGDTASPDLTSNGDPMFEVLVSSQKTW